MRLAVKPQPADRITFMPASTELVGVTRQGGSFDKHGWLCCPYGVTGDQMWVRETWGLHDTQPSDGPAKAHIYYRATDGDRHDLRHQLWRPSSHMPRWASRITLEITRVRVERLHAISKADAIAEAVDVQAVRVLLPGKPSTTRACTPIEAYAAHWASIHGPDAWDANPWVWAIEFKRIKP